MTYDVSDFITLCVILFCYSTLCFGFMFKLMFSLKFDLIEYKAMGAHMDRIRELEIELEAMKRTTHNIQFVDAETLRKQEFQTAPTEKELAAEEDPFSII